jgi:uncharacterized protein (TIGR00251 family)
MTQQSFISKKNDLLYLKIKVISKSSNNLLVGIKNNELVVKIMAPALKNKANKELIDFFSKTLSVAKTQIQIHLGLKSQHKIITIPAYCYDSLLKLF